MGFVEIYNTCPFATQVEIMDEVMRTRKKNLEPIPGDTIDNMLYLFSQERGDFLRLCLESKAFARWVEDLVLSDLALEVNRRFRESKAALVEPNLN